MLDHFGLLAPIYERLIRPRMPERLHHLVALPADGPLLDVGGGTGRVAQFFRREASAVVLVDVSLRMLAQAREKNGLLCVGGTAEGLPFPDGHFARVIIVDALHHVADQDDALREMWRVLRPGGRLVIEEPDVRRFVVKLVALAEKLTLMRSHFLSPPRIAALVADFGARPVIETEGYAAWVVAEKPEKGMR